ncbi:hypothetical protein L596_025028 [Steinernema carpocapsae]|uniref:Uncharacterized protein n=1 Tax=Steinernema carpocapsae TaxID=34508 RepID=A0A4U5M6R5_STECR|nr:hypothetical protein L596_025028 [Steinernema carpocapsae]
MTWHTKMGHISSSRLLTASDTSLCLRANMELVVDRLWAQKVSGTQHGRRLEEPSSREGRIRNWELRFFVLGCVMRLRERFGSIWIICALLGHSLCLFLPCEWAQDHLVTRS